MREGKDLLATVVMVKSKERQILDHPDAQPVTAYCTMSLAVSDALAHNYHHQD